MRSILVLLLLAAVALAERPRLVVVVSVDQMRPDTLARFAAEYRGGLRRVLERGASFRGALGHAATATGPGHSTMLTGCHPARTGIVGNRWLDPATLRPVYCVEGGSPVLLLRDGLGDWMKARDARAKVYSVSGKDRAAILMAGRKPDGAYWLDRRGDGFATSAFYHPETPEWLIAFNGDGWLESLPKEWTYEPVEGLRADNDERESSRYGRASPHPLRTADKRKFLARLYASPYVDDFTLRLARTLVERFDLGGDEVPDLLCISLSATDTVGHLYGPLSQEIRDTTLRLDHSLGEFFAFLDARGAPYVVALTADHGVLPIPEAKRVPALGLMQMVDLGVRKRLGHGALFRIADGQVYVDRERAAKVGVEPDAVVAALGAVLREREEVEAVFDREALGGEAGGELAQLVRHSFHPDRSGDLVVVLKRNLLFDLYGSGTTHGSPWPYDREVPLVFLGPGIRPGPRDKAAAPVDIAPTLAPLIGVDVPAGLDGARLALD